MGRRRWRRVPTQILLLALAIIGQGCYRLRNPPVLGEDIRIVVVHNRARLVRSQVYLQQQVSQAIQGKLGWRIDPRGTASLQLSLEPETISVVATNSQDIPAQWTIVIHGQALLNSRRGAFTTSFIGTGYATGLADEDDGLRVAAADAAASLEAWIEQVGSGWREAAAPTAPPPSTPAAGPRMAPVIPPGPPGTRAGG